MLRLRAYVAPDRVEALGARLASVSGVRHLVLGGQTFGGMTELTGDVETDAADTVLEVLRHYEMDSDDVTLSRAESVQPIGWGRRQGLPERDALVWAEVLGRARSHARPGLLYLLYMVAAGIIAGVGVLTGSSILIVGAMALSPDLLPISATALGLVERRQRLWRRAVATLVLGLGVVVVAAAVATLLLRITGRVPADLDLAHTVLGESFTKVGPGTVLVALAAGMAGMLAYETAGSAAVGVAISVTTIPAAAYTGTAAALRGYQDAGGSLLVLLINVVSILAAATATVWAQRRWRPHASPPVDAAASSDRDDAAGRPA
jgi:uncharacterized hydrophobic protein (TIGR00271 family)